MKKIEESNYKNDLTKQLPNLFKLALKLTKDKSRADDLLQDTMVLALRFESKYSKDTNMRAWLSRIMKNRFISTIRRKNLELATLQTEGNYSIKTWSMGKSGINSRRGVYNEYEDEGFCDPVEKAIGGLKEEYRQAIFLCDINGLSYAEAADKTGRPVGTIMSRLHRGRKSLKQTLGSREQVVQAA